MKRFASMLAMIPAVLVTYVTTVGAATWEDLVGPHATVLNAQAGPAGEYYIRRPATLGSYTHPVAVVLVGSNSHPKSYDGLFAELASHGVVVIAHSSSDQGDGTKANAALDGFWSRTKSAPANTFISWSRPGSWPSDIPRAATEPCWPRFRTHGSRASCFMHLR